MPRLADTAILMSQRTAYHRGMSEIANPHDLLFRQLLSSRETAQDFVRHYLPKSLVACLDLESLELTGDSFVEPKLREHISDIVYRAKLLSDGSPAYVYVLLEHKSQPDPLVGLQLLRYMVRLWERALDQGHKLPLPPVVPVVFYHGRSGWRVSTQFAELIRPASELEAYTPRFRYALVDVSLANEAAAVRGEAILQAMVLAMRHALDDALAQRILWIVAKLSPVATTRTGRQALEALLHYFSAVGEHVDERVLRDAVEQVVPARGDEVMATLAEKWIKDGVQQGVQQGAVATAREFLLAVLSRRFQDIPGHFHQRIRMLEDVTLLRELVEAAAAAESIERFRDELEAACRTA